MTAALVVEFSPGEGPFDTPSWVDLSSRVRSASWQVGRSRDLDEWPSGEATIVLDNSDRLLDPEYAAGTYFGSLNPRTPFRIRSNDGGVYTDEFFGFVEDGFEQTYGPPAEGTCTVRLVDLLGVLAGYRMPGRPFEIDALALGATAYWPLDETSGNTANDRAGSHPATYSDGTTSHGGKDGITFAAITDQASTPDAGALIDAGPKTWSLFVTALPDPEATSGTRVLIQQTDVPSGLLAGAMLECLGAGSWRLVEHGENRYASLPSGIFDDGPVTLAVVNNSGAFSLYADGTLLAGSPYPTGLDISSAAGTFIGASKPTGERADFECLIANVALFDQIALSASDVAALSSRAPWEGDTTGERIDRVLDAIGVPAGLRNVDVGYTTLGAADFEQGTNALDYLRTVARTEAGALFVDHRDGGKLRFRDRYRLYLDSTSTTSVATFTDEDTVGAIHYERGSLVVEPNGIASILNQVSISWTGGTFTVEDAASSGAYGPQGISIDTIAPTVDTARDLADFLVGRYGSPQVRVRGLSVLPTADDNAWTAALEVDVGNRVTVRRLPQGVGAAISSPSIVEGYEQSVEGVERRASFYLSDAETGSFWIWGVSEWGVDTKWGF